MKKALKKALVDGYAVNISTLDQFFVAAVVLEIGDKTVSVTHEFSDDRIYSTYHITQRSHSTQSHQFLGTLATSTLKNFTISQN
jgi:hypothetical protein